MHTPGPWTDTQEAHRTQIVPVGNYENTPVVCEFPEGEFPDGEVDANIRLICAAPALLNTLKLLTAVSECYCAKLPYHGPSTGHTCYRCQALAAIAKAEGK